MICERMLNGRDDDPRARSIHVNSKGKAFTFATGILNAIALPTPVEEKLFSFL